MTEEQLITFVRDAAALGVKWWEIAGGEPFYAPQKAMSFLLAIKKHGMGGSLMTNGSLLTKEMALSLVEAGWDELTFSLDSPRKRVHDKFRGWGSYRKLLKAMGWIAQYRKDIGKAKPALKINSLLTVFNIDEIRDLLKIAAEVTAFGIYFLPPVVVNKYTEQIAAPNLAAPEIQEKLAPALELAVALGLETNLAGFISGKVREDTNLRDALVNRTRQEFLSESPPIACFDPFFRMTADILGRVSPCRDTGAFSVTDQVNLKTGRLDMIWYGDEFEQVRKGILQGVLSEHCNRCCENIIEDNHGLRIAINPCVIRDKAVFYALAGEKTRALKCQYYYNEYAKAYSGLSSMELFENSATFEVNLERALQILEILEEKIETDGLGGPPEEPREIGKMLIERNDRELALSVFIRGLSKQPYNLELWKEMVKNAVHNSPRLAGKLIRIILEIGDRNSGSASTDRQIVPVDHALELAEYVRRGSELRKVNTKNHTEFIYFVGIELRDAGYVAEATKLFAQLITINNDDLFSKLMLGELMGFEALTTGLYYCVALSDRKARSFLTQAQTNRRGERLAGAVMDVLASHAGRGVSVWDRIARLLPCINQAIAEGLLAEPGFFTEPTVFEDPLPVNQITRLLQQQKQFLFKFFQSPSVKAMTALVFLGIEMNRPVEAACLASALLMSGPESGMREEPDSGGSVDRVEEDEFEAREFLLTCLQKYRQGAGKERDAELFQSIVKATLEGSGREALFRDCTRMQSSGG